MVQLYSLAKEYNQKPHTWVGIDTSTDVGRYWAWCIDQAVSQCGWYEHRRIEQEAKDEAEGRMVFRMGDYR
jgi:hypothetical protein